MGGSGSGSGGGYGYGGGGNGGSSGGAGGVSGDPRPAPPHPGAVDWLDANEQRVHAMVQLQRAQERHEREKQAKDEYEHQRRLQEHAALTQQALQQQAYNAYHPAMMAGAMQQSLNPYVQQSVAGANPAPPSREILPYLMHPVRLRAGPWSTDTQQLWRAGWSLSLGRDECNRTQRIGFRSPDGEVRGVTAPYEDDLWRALREGRESFEVACSIATEARVVVHDAPRIWAAISGEPKIVTALPQSLDELCRFEFREAPRERIIVPQENVADLLKRILDMQAPAKERHFRDLVDEERRSPIHRLEAQIVSLREAA